MSLSCKAESNDLVLSGETLFNINPEVRASTLAVRALLLEGVPEKSRQRARLLWLNNFDCEKFWSDPETVHLPSFSSPAETAIVNRMEEMCLWLAGEPDVVILREAPDHDFLSYLRQIGKALPEIVVANFDARSSDSISQGILKCGCEQRLKSLGGEDWRLLLLSYGNTSLEETISEVTGVPLLGPRGETCARVNSKIFGRRLSQKLDFLTAAGYECESLEELERAFKQLKPIVLEGSKVVLKEAMGVSGKGLLVIEQAGKMDQLLDLFHRQHRPCRKYAFVIEEWIQKQKDINYQILITPAGDVRLLAIKESFARGGVHAGHRSPPELAGAQLDAYREAAVAIGKELHSAGYSGVAGIDSIVDREGRIYPVLEINARFNMSTYQLALERTLEPRAKLMVKNYSLLLRSPLPFSALAKGLGCSLFGLNGCMRGVGIMCFATVNCNVDAGKPPAKGRLIVFLVGSDWSEISALDLKTQECLKRCGVTVLAR